MKSRYKTTLSFYGKTRIILALTGIIPFLLIIYLFVYGRIDITEMITLFSALALLSILSGFSLLRSSADQLVKLANETRMIEAGEKIPPLITQGDQEIKDIADHFNAVYKKLNQANMDIKNQSIQLMIYAKDISLAHKKTKKEEALRNRLSRYVGENLVKKVLHSKNGVLIENERKLLTVLFADIRSFTTIVEGLETEEVVFMLNQFFDIMVNIIFKYHGILDKFVGDQLMAIFGLIPSKHEHSYNAIHAALEMQNATEDLMKKRAEENRKTFEIGIGINTGNAIVGNLGSENRLDYTAIGNSVNVAAKLQKIAKGGTIIIGEQTYHQIQSNFHMEKRVKLRLKNRPNPIICYQVSR
jgi:adenylate cyclase